MQIERPGGAAKVTPVSPRRNAPAGRARSPQAHDQAKLSLLAAALSGPADIDQIKAELQSGSYHVDPATLSRRIVEFYLAA